MTNESKKKKGLLALLRESLAKTGGCCGPGETCGGLGKASEKKTATEENSESKETAKK